MRSTAVSRFLRRERGQSLVEFALVLPLFLILIFGIVDFGNAFRQYITLSNAVREGARYGAVERDEAGIRSKVEDTAVIDGLDLANVSVAFLEADSDAEADPVRRGDRVRVSARHQYSPITPLGHWVGAIADGFTISATSTMRVE